MLDILRILSAIKKKNGKNSIILLCYLNGFGCLREQDSNGLLFSSGSSLFESDDNG